MAVKRCNQSACTFNTDGKCLEGLGENCSHPVLEEVPPIKLVVETPKDSRSEDKIKLYSGEELTFNQIPFISHKYNYKMITIIGDFSAGKTTLLATLFDLFQIGPIGEFVFAGSYTQVGFEKRCHQSRVASDRDTPDTERTKSNEFSFLHIATKRKNQITKHATNLILSDVSGERFQNARNSSTEMQGISFISNSDHIVIMIDGQKIKNPKQKYSEITNTETFIKMAIDVGVFGKDTCFKIVLSKWDLLSNDHNFDFVRDIENYFNNLFQDKVKLISYLRIAARPQNMEGDFALGHGLNELLSEWCSSVRPQLTSLESTYNDRSFNNYIFTSNE